MEQRERLVTANSRLEKSSNVLKSAISTAEETVVIGIDTMGNLDEQKNKMKKMISEVWR
jgi:hypothetical protein